MQCVSGLLTAGLFVCALSAPVGLNKLFASWAGSPKLYFSLTIFSFFVVLDCFIRVLFCFGSKLRSTVDFRSSTDAMFLFI